MATVKIFKHHIHVAFLLLLAVETGILFLSGYAGFYLRFGDLTGVDVAGIQNLPLQSMVMAIVFLIGLVAMGQYQAQRQTNRYLLASVLLRVAISLFLGMVGIMIVYYLLPSLYIGRGVLAYSLIFNLFALTLTRLMFYSTTDGNVLRRKVLIYGAGEPAAGLLGLGGNRKNPLIPSDGSYSIHGFIPVEGETVTVPQEYCVNINGNLLHYCQVYDIDEVVVAIKDRRRKMPVNELLDCKLTGIEVIDFISFHERERGMLHLEILQPSWMIFSEGYGVQGLSASISRLFDILVSLTIVAVTLPLLLIATLAILIEGRFKGPVLYSQKRVGFNNVEFSLFKFRSMRVDAEKDGKAVWASKNDSRVTVVGRFIRKTRIDEIPQLFNVLRGEMSLIGPRPERPEFVEQLEKSIPYYRLRHRVKPGLAGWAQIKYPYGANEKDAYNKLQFDLFYIKNRTIFMDLLVLLQTVEVVILGKGAR